MEMTYKPTGQVIAFVGLDDQEKMRSITFPKGYAAITWYEEFHQFSPDDVRSANQSLSRGGEDFWRFYSWNPPRSKNNWVNEWAEADIPGRTVHHSDFSMGPLDWLGSQFVEDAAQLRELNELAYRHEYLGEAVGTDGEVFQNLDIREVTDEEIAGCDYIRCGVDFGFFPDPWVFGRVAYNRKTKTAYILDEVFGQRVADWKAAERAIEIMTEEEERGDTTERVYHAKAKHNEVYCDNADPKAIASYRECGINALPVKKFPGSVDAGVKWLQTRAAIVIDPKRAPLSAHEFPAYEYEDDGQGGLKAYPDKNNHSIDKARYGFAPLIASRKEV
jgi:PBSX family phage terminase large subunit